MGVVPDGLAMPEQLTGRELLGYLGRLRGLDHSTTGERADELLSVLELTGESERTLIIDYSSGMRKKIGLATALLHGPRLLVLDEPFEAVDPVSAATVERPHALRRGRRLGAALEPRHGAGRAALRQVAGMARGEVVAEGPLDEVRGSRTLEETFVELVGVDVDVGGGEGLSWLAS